MHRSTEHRCGKKPFSFRCFKSIGAAMVPIAFGTRRWHTATLSPMKFEIRAANCFAAGGCLLLPGCLWRWAVYLEELNSHVACARSGWTRCHLKHCLRSMRIALGEPAPGIALAITNFALVSSQRNAHRSARSITRWTETEFSLQPDGEKRSAKSEAPVVAIVLQGFAAIVHRACSGKYGRDLESRSCRFHFFRDDKPHHSNLTNGSKSRTP